MVNSSDTYRLFGGNGQSESISALQADADSGTGITFELVTSDVGFDSLQNEWNQLVEKTGAHVFQCFEWQRLWWKHFGEGHQLYIITFRKYNELVGIVPCFLERTPILFNWCYWKMRFIGSSVPANKIAGTFNDYSPTDYLDIIAAPEHEDQIADYFLNCLAEAVEQFYQFNFDEVPEDGILMRKVLPELKKRNWYFQLIRKETCPRINLPKSMDDYLLGLSGKARYELRYSKRAVSEKKLFRVENVETEEDLHRAFNDFVRLHQERWNRQGLPGAFIDQRIVDYLKEVTETFFKQGWMRLKTARLHGQCLAVDYAFKFNNRIYDYQKAFDETSPMAKYGPGKTLLYDLVNEAIEEGCTVFDLLRGSENYKMRIANDSRCNWNVIISNPNANAGIRHKWYAFLSLLRSFYTKMELEKLMLKMHVKERGPFRFLPVYTRFLSKRIQEKFHDIRTSDYGITDQPNR
jgi:CelD/BcsL family acetyltransferase involved in cellulose biosynthesis